MANRNFSELVRLLMPHAVYCLSEQCQFQPFGAIIDMDGQIVPSVARAGSRRIPTRKDVEKLKKRYVDLAATKQILAMSVCHEIPRGDTDRGEHRCAISCFLEDANGDALELMLPFTRDIDSKSLLFGTLTGKLCNPQFFPLGTKTALPRVRRA
jgi:hypothetical protein